jgi:hypothetical protein
VGFLLDQESLDEWKHISKAFKQRIEQLASTKTPLPWTFLESEPSIKTLYRQSIFCYLFGLFDSCFFTLLRLIEASLQLKYGMNKGKQSSSSEGMRLEDLFDLASLSLKNNNIILTKEFRQLTHYARTELNPFGEQDCLEAIGTVSRVLESLQPSQHMKVNVVCHYCHTPGTASVVEEQKYIGNKISLDCQHCKRVFHWMIMPEPAQISV